MAHLFPQKLLFKALKKNGKYETEYIFIDKMNIKPCRGCLSCWGRPDGSCFIKDDDIPAIRERLTNADVVIWSFPLFLFGIPGQMKVLLERIVGMLLSSCAWSDIDVVYEPIVKQFDCILGHENYQLIACPQMRALHHRGGERRLEVLRKRYWLGGAELAKMGKLSQESIDLMQKNIFGDDAYEKLVVEFITHMFNRNDNF